jgi:hypothetical protein
MATPEQWRDMEQWTKQPSSHGSYSNCIVELRCRVEALEAAANYPAKPDSSTAPAGSLVQRVAQAIADDGCAVDVWHDIARAAIREVAAWMRQNEIGYAAAAWLEREAKL